MKLIPAPRSRLTLVLATVALLLPATVWAETLYIWATPSDGLWSEAANWAPTPARPGDDPLDSVILAAFGPAYRVTLDLDRTLRNFTLESPSATLYLPANTLTVTGNSVITAGTLDLTGGQYHQVGGTFTYQGGTIIGHPVELTDAQLYLGGSAGAAFNLHGQCAMSGSVALLSPHVVSVVAAAQPAKLTGLAMNMGQLNLTSSSADDVTLDASPSLSNFGILNCQLGAGGARIFTGNLSNNAGAVAQFHAETRFTRSNPAILNSGVFHIGPTGSIELSGPAAASFTQTDGDLSVEGHLGVTKGTFKFMGGTITGQPIRITDGTLSLGSQGAASFVLRGSSSLISSPNAGVIATGQTVSLLADGAPARLNSTLNLNAGILALDSTTAHDVTLSQNTTLVNQGTLNVLPGGGGNRILNSSLDSSGTVHVAAGFRCDGLTLTNSGDFELTPTGSVALSGFAVRFIQAAGHLDNQGQITVHDGAFEYHGGTITGNPIQLFSADVDVRDSGHLSVEMRGTGRIVNGTDAGALSAGQSVRVLADGGTARAEIMGSNAGHITLDSATAHNTVLAIGNSATSAAFTNTGTVETLPGAGGLRQIVGNFSNQPGGTLDIHGTTQFTLYWSQIVNAGTINLWAPDASIICTKNTLSNELGLIRGIGTIDVTTGTLNNSGTITPGLDIGILAVVGDFHQLSAGNLVLDLAGRPRPGTDYDQLSITGTAYLDGTLELHLLNGFAPQLGDAFQILTFAATQGTFESLNLPNLGDGLAWDTSTLYQDGTIRVATPEPVSIALAMLSVAFGMGARRRGARG